jgi:hypothetical protein
VNPGCVTAPCCTSDVSEMITACIFKAKAQFTAYNAKTDDDTVRQPVLPTFRISLFLVSHLKKKARGLQKKGHITPVTKC